MVDKKSKDYCQGFGDCKSRLLQSIEKCLTILHEEIQYSLNYNEKGGEWPQTTPEQLANMRIKVEAFKHMRAIAKSMKPQD